LVLLHYHVVPGLGDSNPQPQATAVRTDEQAAPDCDDVATVLLSPCNDAATTASRSADSVRAA
jgi:hypothetical protein